MVLKDRVAEWEALVGEPDWKDPEMKGWLEAVTAAKVRERKQIRGAFATAKAIGDVEAMAAAARDAAAADNVLAALAGFAKKV